MVGYSAYAYRKVSNVVVKMKSVSLASVLYDVGEFMQLVYRRVVQ